MVSVMFCYLSIDDRRFEGDEQSSFRMAVPLRNVRPAIGRNKSCSMTHRN